MSKDRSEYWSSSYWSGWSSSVKKKEGVAASSYWTDRFSWDSYSWKPDTEPDLTNIIRSIRRTANVLSNVGTDGSERLLSVEWASLDNSKLDDSGNLIKSTKRNSAKSDTIYISPDVINNATTLRTRWTEAERTDVLLGEVMAESTMKRTVDPAVEQNFDGTPRKAETAMAKTLWYTLERLAAEKEVLRGYPGFAGYFAAHRDYYTSPFAFKQLSKLISEEENAVNCFKALLWELLHPSEHLELQEKTQGVIDTAMRFLEASKDTSRGREATAYKIVEEILRVFPIPPHEQQEALKALGEGAGDKKGESRGQNLGLPALKRETPVPTEVTVEREMDPDGKATLASLPAEFVEWRGGTFEYMVPRTAPSSDGSDDTSLPAHVEYKRMVGVLAESIRALRNRLKLRNEEKTIIEHGLRRGQIDEGSLYKLSFHKMGHMDRNIFEETEILSRPNTAFCLLVDESGSMNHRGRYAHARKLAIVLANALKSVVGIRFCVIGHTGQGEGHSRYHDGLILNHYYTPSNPSIESLGAIYKFSQNLDGYAIAAVGKKMLDWYSDCPRKVIVHISDGTPEASGYGGEPAIRHTRGICDAARRSNVHVIGIGVDNAFSPATGEAIYGPGNFTVIPKVEDSHVVVAKLITDIANRPG